MQQKESGTLTQGELVEELHNQGRIYVNARDVANWRKLELLPEFDAIGQGRGRGAGRAPSVWAQGESVLNQAAWIHDLRGMYRTYEGLYLPLWMIGYPISFKYVRKAIVGPLNKAIKSVENAVRDAKKEIAPEDKIGVEDVLDDAAAHFDSQNAEVELFHFPQAALEASIQLIFNSDYRLDDTPFEEAVAALKNWELSHRKGRTDLPDSDANIFEYAPLFKEYFSLQRVKEAVSAAKKSDFLLIQRDLGMVRELMTLLNRALSLLLTDAPPELKAGLEESSEYMFPAFFTFGRLFVLADLSLRHNGYGERIDYVLPEILNRARSEFNEEMERKLKAASAQVVSGMQSTFKHLIPMSESPHI